MPGEDRMTPEDEEFEAIAKRQDRIQRAKEALKIEKNTIKAMKQALKTFKQIEHLGAKNMLGGFQSIDDAIIVLKQAIKNQENA
jgi:inorganic pyrophosphatase